ncbi:hypothetical protein [Chitinophaga sp.]|uniref:hypothetical protein n=1 Tax=Chitinophaga sp. TaxID=1869181 RepID=UPI0031D89F1E
MEGIKKSKMKYYTKFFYALIFILFTSCNSDKEIIRLLNSEEKEDIILGAYKAGKTGDKQFVPLLLKNAADRRASINIKFKGFTVYQEKMLALQKIFKQAPPAKITDKPDSLVINFYTELSKEN